MLMILGTEYLHEYNMRKNNTIIAQKYLGIPATSVASEWLFPMLKITLLQGEFIDPS